MGRKQEKEILKHITLDELNKIIKKEEKSVRVLERLYFIRFLYKGDKIKSLRQNRHNRTDWLWLA